MIVALALVAFLSGVPAALRWLRVAQREHYLAGQTLRFAARWWSTGLNPWLAAMAVGGIAASAWSPLAALLALPALVAGPIGLGVKGRTSKLAWTPRLRRLAVAVGVAWVAGVLLGFVLDIGVQAAFLTAVATPLVVDIGLGVTAPLEALLGRRWIDQAVERLEAVSPEVVAITGSYGKTTTKVALGHLASGSRSVVTSPASYNNAMGLARTINEHLASGTEVLVAEMGTYGPGEIADLCSWLTPNVAVITAIGPVHLERFGSLEAIVAAKSEILTNAATAVLNVDDPLLAKLADTLENVVRCGTSDGADVRVKIAEGVATVEVGDDRRQAAAPEGVIGSNLACAIGAAMAIGVGLYEVVARIPTIPETSHRRTIGIGQTGTTIIDDTYNANPAGAGEALSMLAGLEVDRRVVVTPGMVELGHRQDQENEAFGARAAAIADTVIVVGATNRAALIRGANTGTAEVIVVSLREDAVAWVRANAGQRTAVLYENDLPDHYA